jgi:DivIVA domain-containing protein
VITVLEYLVIAAVIGAIVFGIAVVVFGRGEQMAPLPARTSPSELPAHDLRGDHVRQVRFGLALRGYRMSDVDWTLERLADEIDTLRGRLDAAAGPTTAGDATAGAADNPGGGEHSDRGSDVDSDSHGDAESGSGNGDAESGSGPGDGGHPRRAPSPREALAEPSTRQW